MAFITDQLEAATARIADLVGKQDATVCAVTLGDDSLLAGLSDITSARKSLDLLEAAFTAEIERRSDRSLGHAGLAQRTGHRTATLLVQSMTGKTRAEVQRATSAGRDLAAAVPARSLDPDAQATDVRETDAAAAGPALPEPWFAPLTDALSRGALSRDQYDAIRRGLGEPPVIAHPDADPDELVTAWRMAATVLIEEASDRPVEDLRADARLARDTLDPVGVKMRFEERLANRSFIVWTDEHGQQHGHIRFDDENAAWWRTVLGAALRPRRGPRFVDPQVAKEISDDLAHDSRTNEQLQYDTVMAIFRTGAQADPAQAFGDRQPGIRILVTEAQVDTRDAHGTSTGVAHVEETGQTIPGYVLDAYLCNAATKIVTVDAFGTPLDVGREQRTFTKKQRVVISLRDGGCLDCGAEPSRCEVHHIKPWSQGGRTDTKDGILLCTFSHLRIHNSGQRVERVGSEYWLHSPPRPDGTAPPPRLLRSRSLLRFYPAA